MRISIGLTGLLLLFLPAIGVAQKRSTAIAAPKFGVLKALTVITEPKAAVWLDNLRRGTTDESGRLKIENIRPGVKKLRVRAVGFSEKTIELKPAPRGEVSVSLTKTTDEAELAFQEAEFLRESGRDANRQKAAELYRQAIKLKPSLTAAHIGLARVLNDLNEPDAALQAIATARKASPTNAEISVVEGRIYRTLEDSDNAIKAFRRALREARNVQPEAHTGLALALLEKDETNAAIAEFKIALGQLQDSEPIVYQLLGETYEKAGRHKEAIVAYEKFLQLSPNSNLTAGVRSIVEQLKLKKQDDGETLELLPQ